mgnify:FL=1
MLGVPTLATRVGGNTEVITDGEDGLLVAPGAMSALVAALTRILRDGELRTHLSVRALESAKRFSTDTMLTATADFFKTL